MARRPHGAWYAITAVPIALGALIAVWALMGMVDQIKGMPRLEIPGEREVELHAGGYILYAETQSVVDGHSVAHTAFDGRCTLTDADGAELAFDSKSSSTSYTLGDYKGKSVAEVDVPRDGTYTLSCTGDDGVVALGGGIGARIVYVVVSILGGLAASIVLFFIVRRRRKR